MQSNTNGAPKEWGIKLGSQVRCFKLVTGTKANGDLWGFFTYVEKEKDTKKPLQKYNLWLVNDYNFIANFPLNNQVDLRIERIDSVKPISNSYTNKEGKTVNERIINLEVAVSIVSVINNNNNQGYQNQQPNQYQNNPNSFDVDKKINYNEPLNKSNEVEQAESFLDIDIDESDLPF